MAAAWRVAGSLDQLLDQLNALAPRRSRASDGSIGDAVHASRSSDHNPWLVLAGQAYVTARDFTHDPAGGLDCDRLADALRRGRDPRVKYVIWQRRIMAGAAGPSPWTWRPYSGTNAHTKHLHLSVVGDARALPRIPWQLDLATRPAPAPAPSAPARDEVDMATLDELRALVREVVREEVPDAVWRTMVPDFYPAVPSGQEPPTLEAWAALAWVTTHAARARDEAAGARAGISHVSEQVGQLATKLTTAVIDYGKLAGALLSGLRGG